MSDLMPGDPIYFVQNKRKLSGIVADTLNIPTDGEELLVPVIRPINRKTPLVMADRENREIKLKTRWLKRSEVFSVI